MLVHKYLIQALAGVKLRQVSMWCYGVVSVVLSNSVTHWLTSRSGLTQLGTPVCVMMLLPLLAQLCLTHVYAVVGDAVSAS